MKAAPAMFIKVFVNVILPNQFHVYFCLLLSLTYIYIYFNFKDQYYLYIIFNSQKKGNTKKVGEKR